MEEVLAIQASRPAKIMMLEALMAEMREVEGLGRGHEQLLKGRASCEVLSTSISECQSINYQNEKDIEELEEKIIRMRMVKIENNEDIETYEEELEEIEKIVKAKSQINDTLKRQIDSRMESIHSSGQKN